MVRAKFKLNSYETQLDYKTQEELRSLKFSVVTDGSTENREFFKYTPSGAITIGVLNKAAWTQFQLGEEYFVDFTPCNPPGIVRGSDEHIAKIVEHLIP